jgi:hypothetical protein
LILGCDCYNYCNGEFNGCCGYFEGIECEQDCVGVVVAGCDIDSRNMNMTTAATLAPNAPTPGSTTPEPPGGSGPQPPGGGDSQPTSPGGGPPAPGGGSPPGSKQYDDDDLTVPLPPFALRFFLPSRKEKEGENDFIISNRYPTTSDYVALESVTDVFVRNYVMETIGNGLNVVMDDIRTIVLSKPDIPQADTTMAEVEVSRTGGKSNVESLESAKIPLEALFIVFVSTAVLDSTSPTVPHPYDLLKHVQGAFAGDNLMSYLNMLQALQPSDTVDGGMVGNIFASTTDVLWVPTTSDGIDNNPNNSPSSQPSSNGAIIAVFVIVIVILFVMILRMKFGRNCCRPLQQLLKQKKLCKFENIMLQSSASHEIYENKEGSFRDDICIDMKANTGSSIFDDDNNNTNNSSSNNNSPLKDELIGVTTRSSSPFFSDKGSSLSRFGD